MDSNAKDHQPVVVVGFDGSADARAALRYALEHRIVGVGPP